jgi:thiamine-phosphate pyrophosphorylase
MKRTLNISLQLVLEPHSNLPWLIQEAVKGGVTCVQWRDKFFNDQDFYERAVLIKSVCHELNVPLIVNDRLDIALAIGADALHLGQNDLPFEVARRLLPDHMAIGLSADCLEDVERAENLDVDYLAISPVFETQTKMNTSKPFGLEGFQKARQISRHKLVAIGGINVSNAVLLRQSGADGLAIVSAICRSENPQEAARAFAV